MVAAMQTKRLTLNLCRPEDRADFLALERDPFVMRFLNGGFAVVRDQIEPDAAFLMPEGTEDYVWTARRNPSGAFVGWFCLWPAGDGSAEIGYRLRRTDWGQGFASEGAATLIEWGFSTQRYHRISATALVSNHASRRVLEKMGLRYVRTDAVGWSHPFVGSEEGEAQYELMRSDWNGS